MPPPLSLSLVWEFEGLGVLGYLIPHVLCDHTMVVTNSFWPLWHQLRWFLDCFNYSSCSCLGMLCLVMWVYVDSPGSSVQTWDIVLSIGFIVEPLHVYLLDNCHLCVLGQHIWYMFLWSLCANDSQWIWECAWYSNATYPRHLPLECLVGHVLVGVNPCGRCTIVALPPQIAQLP